MKHKYQMSVAALCFLIAVINQNLSAQTYSPLPFRETFEGNWINKDNTRDVPSVYWNNTPATSDSSWSRNDDGVARGAWSSLSGAYTPGGANITAHSARFHAYAAPNGKSGILDLYVDFSVYTDTKTLSFWYINKDGYDSLKVYLSTDGGTTFGTALSKKGVQSSWAKTSLNLGTITSSTCVIRFKATSDFGFSDIGLDEVGITTPTTPISVNFYTNKITGMAPVLIQFIDSSSLDLTSWEWDFNNDATPDATIQSPKFTYSAAGTYTVKLTGSKGGAPQSITRTNLITVTASQYASLPFSESFESTWIDRDNVRDVPSLYFSSNPSTGNNSWSREDDPYRAWEGSSGAYDPEGAFNSLHSARFHSYYTSNSGILDAYIDFSTQAGDKTLTFWYINKSGSDKLEVFLSTNGGTTFGSALNTQTTSSNWTKVTINLGSITSSTGIVRFKATGDDGSTDIGLDQIYIESPSASPVVADFSTNITSGTAPFTINFTDQSTGAPTSWAWDLNDDGITDSVTQNPSYLYSTPGVYTITLIASKTGSTDTEIKDSYIVVYDNASLPFSENFENTWVDRDGTRDVPSLYFSNNPATGSNSWSRDDDPYRAWGSSLGSYTPKGALSSLHSARFHSYETESSGMLDAHIDFSTQTGDKTLTFWYINPSGSDNLEVFLSIDGGSTFGSALTTQTTSSNWTKVTINLGSITSSTGIMRFKATGDYGSTDIGLDNIYIESQSASPIVADFSTNITSGTAPFTVNFADQSTGAPTSWAWDFNNDGTTDSLTQNPSYLYSAPGVYTVKLIASKTGSSDTEIKTSYIFAAGYASLPLIENFENPWVSRDNTRDVPSYYTKNTPATGNNSWSRDDDGEARGAWSGNNGSYSPAGNSSLHSARFHSYDASDGSSGNLDFYINFSSLSGDKTLTFWTINSSGYDSLKVYLSTDGGTTFGSALTSQVVNTSWTKVSIDLGNVTTNNGVVRFRAVSDYGFSDIGLDNVSVDITTGTSEYQPQKIQSAYPNPSTGIVYIPFDQKLINESITIKVMDSFGKMVINTQSDYQEKYILDLSGYPSGLYYIQVIGNKQIFISKVIKM